MSVESNKDFLYWVASQFSPSHAGHIADRLKQIADDYFSDPSPEQIEAEPSTPVQPAQQEAPSAQSEEGIEEASDPQE